jgi:dolichol-phosphate mannosyltransferase
MDRLRCCAPGLLAAVNSVLPDWRRSRRPGRGSRVHTVGAESQRVIMVVPTYNEAENLVELADRVLAALPSLELLVVDDNSPDGTGAIADKIAAQEPRFGVMHRTGRRGYACASREALAGCRDNGYDFVLTMDADLSHDPARIPALLERAREGAGLVVGSRYIDGGGVEAHWGPIRHAVSEMGSRYARAMIGTHVSDCTSGYRCYSAEALRALRFEDLHSEGYTFLIEVLSQLVSAGVEVAEVPITYTDRQHGASKISRRIVIEALIETTGIGVRRFFGR